MKVGRKLEISGFVGPGTEVHGTVRFRRLLRVDGVVTGRVESYDTLVVGREGRVEAEVIVGALQVYGLVRGRIAVDSIIEIFPGGRVEGELYASAPGVKISEGGVFEGQLHMNPQAGGEADRRRAPEADQAQADGAAEAAGVEPQGT